MIAGAIGIDPSPFTLRELVWMFEGRKRDMWEYTTHLIVTLCNVNRDPRTTAPVKFEDAYPFGRVARAKEAPIDKEFAREMWQKVSGQRGR